MTNSIEKKSNIYSDGGTGISVLSQLIKDVDGNVVYRDDKTPVKRYNYELHSEVFNKDENPLELVHHYISNLKSMIHGIYHGLSLPYLDLFIAEYNWRYNNRTEYKNDRKMNNLLSSFFESSVHTTRMFEASPESVG